MSRISRLTAAARRVLGAAVILGMLVTSALAIFVIAILFGMASKLSQRHDEERASSTASSYPLPGPDVPGGGNQS